MRIFTLRNKMTGNVQKILNGKLLLIRQISNHLQLIDACTHTVLVNTSGIVDENEVPDGIVYRTQSGTKYDFVDVRSLIPTNVESFVPGMDANGCVSSIPVGPSTIGSAVEVSTEIDDSTSIDDEPSSSIDFNQFVSSIPADYVSSETEIDESNSTSTYNGSYIRSRRHKSIEELVSEYSACSSAPSNLDFAVIHTEDDYQPPNNHRDGYTLTRYTFDRDISENEFCIFLDEINIKYNLEQEYPYEDYYKIFGNGNTWTLKKILCYID